MCVYRSVYIYIDEPGATPIRCFFFFFNQMRIIIMITNAVFIILRSCVIGMLRIVIAVLCYKAENWHMLRFVLWRAFMWNYAILCYCYAMRQRRKLAHVTVPPKAKQSKATQNQAKQSKAMQCNAMLCEKQSKAKQTKQSKAKESKAMRNMCQLSPWTHSIAIA